MSNRRSLCFFPGFKCPICSKSVASDEMEMHFIMCLSKPRLSYNGKGSLCVQQLAREPEGGPVNTTGFARQLSPGHGEKPHRRQTCCVSPGEGPAVRLGGVGFSWLATGKNAQMNALLGYELAPAYPGLLLLSTLRIQELPRLGHALPPCFASSSGTSRHTCVLQLGVANQLLVLCAQASALHPLVRCNTLPHTAPIQPYLALPKTTPVGGKGGSWLGHTCGAGG